MLDTTETTEFFVRFCEELRSSGLGVGSGEVIAFTEAVSELNPGDLVDVYWAGSSTLVSRRDQLPVYDSTFRRYFLSISDHEPDELKHLYQNPEGHHSVVEIPSPNPGLGEDREEDEARLGYAASGVRVSRFKSFESCTDDELAAIRRIISTVKLTPPMRRTRRYVSSDEGRRIDVRRMVRESMRRNGDVIRLHRRRPRMRLRPLVFILDVSGSMSDYSRNLLQFAYSANRAADRVEVFCFGTTLTRITRAIDRRRPDEALRRAAELVFDWDGGTQIGRSLDHFVRSWGRRGFSRSSIVVICSDGLDRGDVRTLSKSMERLSRLAHRIVWMNPHVSDRRDYRPTSLGMMVAEPYIDEIFSGHNLASLEDFARHLASLR